MCHSKSYRSEEYIHIFILHAINLFNNYIVMIDCTGRSIDKYLWLLIKFIIYRGMTFAHTHFIDESQVNTSDVFNMVIDHYQIKCH